MSFHFQNVVIFRNVFSLSKCERSTEIVQKLRFDIVLKIHVPPHLRKLTKSFTNSLWHMVISNFLWHTVISNSLWQMTMCHKEFVNDFVNFRRCGVTWIFKTISNLNFWTISVDPDTWIFKKIWKLHFWPISVDPGKWSFKIISNVIFLEYPLPVVWFWLTSQQKRFFHTERVCKNWVPRAVYDCPLGWRRKYQRSCVLNDFVSQRICRWPCATENLKWPCATENLRWPCATENLRWPLQLLRKTFENENTVWKKNHILKMKACFLKSD